MGGCRSKPSAEEEDGLEKHDIKVITMSDMIFKQESLV